ncbi:hypothetical protein ACQPZX_02865 [Actinoplanes sp. CA-142083]|uniref:hypothetical protein n=1 Tax=Actinoplanes sp. CA-142083 TaxID=3239903 RepID=UPI003D8D9BF4
MHGINTPVRSATAEIRSPCKPENPHSEESSPVADLLFVVLTVALFAALTVLIRAVERW